MRQRLWLWLHIFLMWLALSWSGFILLIGENPPPLILLLGIVQALIVFIESEKAMKMKMEKEDVPQKDSKMVEGA